MEVSSAALSLARDKAKAAEDRQLCIDQSICPRCAGNLVDEWEYTTKFLWFTRKHKHRSSDLSPFVFLKCMGCDSEYIQ